MATRSVCTIKMSDIVSRPCSAFVDFQFCICALHGNKGYLSPVELCRLEVIAMCLKSRLGCRFSCCQAIWPLLGLLLLVLAIQPALSDCVRLTIAIPSLVFIKFMPQILSCSVMLLVLINFSHLSII